MGGGKKAWERRKGGEREEGNKREKRKTSKERREEAFSLKDNTSSTIQRSNFAS